MQGGPPVAELSFRDDDGRTGRRRGGGCLAHEANMCSNIAVRWGNQKVSADGVGSDAALPGMGGLLRSVRTPEFAGMVFHEVEAKSVLNKVPGGPMPFGWTVNPYRGCSHACTYCAVGETPVLLGDGRIGELAGLRVGDAVYGTLRDRLGRRFVRTRVLAHWSTVRAAVRVTLADGGELVTSGDHRLLTPAGWKHVAPGAHGDGCPRPYLRPGDVLVGTGRFAAGAHGGESYRRGYLRAARRASASLAEGTIGIGVPGRMRTYLPSMAAATGRTALVSGAPRPVVSTVPSGGSAAANATALPGEEWQRGVLAGALDFGGTSSGGVVRFRVADTQLAGWIGRALSSLGFEWREEPPRADGVRVLRLGGGQGERVRFFHTVDPSTELVLDGEAVADPAVTVTGIEPLGVTLPMYDITTGTGDFVTNGVISHNCFARNTHTYLDLDPGEDFNRQVVVKVNVARVLERELRSRRWAREHVAMGTNTDPYQRAEGRYRLMPGVLTALARSGTPFSVLTKGTLLARDLPLLRAASADVAVGVGVSIALADRALQASLEPGTPTPDARLDLVRRIADAGLSCGVMVAPVLPLLTDSVEALDALLSRVAAAGATGATVLALHLRPGTREWFMSWLAREHTALVGPYQRLYRRGAYVDARYREALAARVRPLLRRYGLAGGAEQRGSPDERSAEQPAGWPRGSLPELPGPARAAQGGDQLSLL
ncbi:MAG TPA: intein-containing Rv2578c family radical SAM protein [Pseudonocardia sp.]